MSKNFLKLHFYYPALLSLSIPSTSLSSVLLFCSIFSQHSPSPIQAAVEKQTQGSMHVFGTLLTSIERSQAQLLEAIEMGRRSAEYQAESMLRELDMEVTELRKRNAALAKLAQTEDCISGLKVET